MLLLVALLMMANIDRALNAIWEVKAERSFDMTRFESVQRGEMTVQELFLGGKLKMEGDYSLALQISMQLLTNPL